MKADRDLAPNPARNPGAGRMAAMRLILIAAVALGLAPGTWLRSPARLVDHQAPVIFTPLALPQINAGEAALLRGWRMTSANEHFGGFSALAAIDGQTLVSASDRGRILHLSLGDPATPAARMERLGDKAQPDKRLTDVESMAFDPVSGTFWIGYEGVNAIERLDRNFGAAQRVQPPQMRNWPANKGAEAMARLNDGRFIVLAEGNPGWNWDEREFPGLLFPADPLGAREALSFRFSAPPGYRPVDMVQIPDGRMVILLRKLHWQLPPRFSIKLVVADLDGIKPGGLWHGRQIAAIKPPLPSDNYEGLAMWPRADGSLNLWIISDDNGAAFQNTYLLQMRWDPRLDKPARPAGSGQ